MSLPRRSLRLRSRQSLIHLDDIPEARSQRRMIVRNGRRGSEDRENLDQPELNPDLADLLPNEQVQGDAQLEFQLGEHNNAFLDTISKTVCSCIRLFIVSLVVFIAILAAYVVTSVIFENYMGLTEIVRSVKMRNMEKFATEKPPANYYRDKDIYFLRKLRRLEKEVAAFQLLRNVVLNEIHIIRNETLQELYDHLQLINQKIDEALTLYDADKIGMIDYALESVGGFVVSTPDTVPAASHTAYDVMGLISIRHASSPRLLIQAGTLPGQCFAFKGSYGRIRIKLAQPVHVTAFTMEHTYAALIEDLHSAPKDFKVYGLDDGDSKTGDALGAFTYKLNMKPLQTFYLHEKSSKSYDFVELQVLNNHGNAELTCVYRFRVHGTKKGFKYL